MVRLLAVLVLAALAGVLLWQRHGMPRDWHSDLSRAECCLDVVHAGGLWEGRPYTNGHATARASAAEGRTLIELDFLLTTDGALVTAHDWDALGGAPLSLVEAMARTDPVPFDMPGLLDFLEDCAACRIVTDTKDPFGPFLDRLVDAVPPDVLRDRFVVQVYSPAEGREVAGRLPGQPLIFTAYKMAEVTDAELDALLALPALAAFTMPLDRVASLAPRIHARAPGFPILAHGPPERMARPAVLAAARRAGATGFYLDARP